LVADEGGEGFLQHFNKQEGKKTKRNIFTHKVFGGTGRRVGVGRGGHW